MLNYNNIMRATICMVTKLNESKFNIKYQLKFE